MAAHLPPGFRRVFRRELRQIAARPGLAFMLGPFPFVLFVLLAAVFHVGMPTRLPIALVDQDGSSMSRQIGTMLDASPDIAVAQRLPTLTEARRALLRGEVYGIVLVPQDAERDLLLGNSPEIAVFYNNQMLTIGGIVSRATTTVLTTFSAGVSVELLTAQGETRDEATASVQPVPVQQSPLFNPALDYVQFLLATVMPTVLQIFAAVAAAMAIARERHSCGGLVRLMRIGRSPPRVLAGKLLPYALAFIATLWLADLIVFGYFGAPFNGSLVFHVLYGTAFILACLTLGTLVGLLTRDTVSALAAAGVLTAPAFGFVGISFPRTSMNLFARLWGDVLPVTSYLELRTDQVVRGADIAVSLPGMVWLIALLALFGGLSLLLLRRQARTERRAS